MENLKDSDDGKGVEGKCEQDIEELVNLIDLDANYLNYDDVIADDDTDGQGSTVFKAVIQNFKARFPSAVERKPVILDTIDEVQTLLKSNQKTTDHDCFLIISTILEHVLDQNFTTSQLRDTLHAGVMTDLVTSLLMACGDASVFIAAMAKVVRGRNVWSSSLVDYVMKLVHNVTAVMRTSFPSKPFFVIRLLDFFTLCVRQQTKGGEKLAINLHFCDKVLAEVIRSSVHSENKESINVKNGESLTALHITCRLLLPMGTRELLQHPEIDVNVRDKRGETPLLQVINKDQRIQEIHVAIFRNLLAHPRVQINVAVSGRPNAIVDYIFHHLTKDTSDAVRVLQIIQDLFNHHLVTSDMCKTGFINFVRLHHTVALTSDRFDAALRSIITNRKLNPQEDLVPNRNAVNYCLDRMKNVKYTDYILRVLVVLCEELSCRGEKKMLVDAFVCAQDSQFLHRLEPSGKVLRSKLLNTIISSPKFPLDIWISGTNPAAHLASRSSDVSLISFIIRQERFNPDAKDGEGNTALYVICAHARPDQALQLLHAVPWNNRITNNGDQNVYEYYVMHVRQPDRNLAQALIRFTQRRSIRHLVALLNPANQPQIEVIPSSYEFYRAKYPKIEEGLIYDLSRARKGKACVIGVSDGKFTKGQELEKKTLTNLWHQLGFDVYVTKTDELPAKDLEECVEEFSCLLDESDQCSVLCIMTHGSEDDVYATDRLPVRRHRICSRFNNENCSQMAGKPKIIIIDACRGVDRDLGVTVLTPNDEPDARLYPTSSDMIICLPTTHEFMSVYRRDIGSPYIRSIVETFAGHAHDEDIQTLLTRVHQTVSQQMARISNEAGIMEPTVQMPHMDSTLTKSLYFLPSPGGRTGVNWGVERENRETTV